MSVKKSTRWVERNVNPIGANTEDCVTRALSTAFAITYQEAATLQAYATTRSGYAFRKRGNQIYLFENLLGIKRCSYRGTVNTLAAKNGNYSLFVGTSGHAVAIVGNRFVDSFDSGRKRVQYYFPISDNDRKRVQTFLKSFVNDVHL